MVVGISSTALNFVVYAGLVTIGWDYLLAAAVAFVLATVNGYTWHRRWTFRAGAHDLAHLMRFTVVQLTGLAVNLAALALAVEVLHVSRLPGQLLANTMVVASNFIGHKLWTFRSRPLG